MDARKPGRVVLALCPQLLESDLPMEPVVLSEPDVAGTAYTQHSDFLVTLGHGKGPRQ